MELGTLRLADILELETCRHLPRDALRQRSYLRVNVREVREGCPTSDSHDRAVRGATQFHSHGSAGSQTVGRNPVEGVATGEEAI